MALTVAAMLARPGACLTGIEGLTITTLVKAKPFIMVCNNQATVALPTRYHSITYLLTLGELFKKKKVLEN